VSLASDPEGAMVMRSQGRRHDPRDGNTKGKSRIWHVNAQTDIDFFATRA
jgi:hypothetical protein